MSVSSQRRESGGEAAGGAIGRRVPDFFIIGHQKCGTTALYLMLKDHPQVFLPEHKEPRFFSPELWPQMKAGRPDHPQTLEHYLALFEGAQPGQRVGEASPQYIRSPTAASAIAELQPNARIIAILREPAAFLRSFHLQMVASNVETEKQLERALALEQQRRADADGSPVLPQLLYSEHVRYVEQLKRYEAHFSRKNMLVLIYDDFRRDNEAAIRQVQRFLEIDDSVPLQAVETAPLKAVRSMRLHQFRRAIRRAEFNPSEADPLSRAITALTPRKLRKGALATIFRRAAYTPQRQPDEALMQALRGRYKPEVESLAEWLDRDLVTQWGYDHIS